MNPVIASIWKHITSPYVVLAWNVVLVVSVGVGFSRLQADREASPSFLRTQAASVEPQTDTNAVAPWHASAVQIGSMTVYIVGTQEQLEIVQERLQQEAIVRSSTGVGERAFTPGIFLVDTPEKEAQTRQLIGSVRMDGIVGNFILEVIDLRDR